MNALNIAPVSARPSHKLLSGVAALGILLGAVAPAGSALAVGGGSGPTELAPRPEPVRHANITLKRGVIDSNQPVRLSFGVETSTGGEASRWLDLAAPEEVGHHEMVPMESLSLNYTKVTWISVETSPELAKALSIELAGEDGNRTFELKSIGRDGIARFEPVGDLVYSDEPWVQSCSECTAICQTITFFGPEYNWGVDLGPQPSASACIDAGIEACGVPMSFFFQGTCKP